MRTLYITLKRKWFLEIAEGGKKEEYREIKMYWIRKLFMQDNDDETKLEAFRLSLLCGYSLQQCMDKYSIKPTYYAIVKASNGYNPNSPAIQWQHLGVRVGKPNPEYCEQEDIGNTVFILDIGKIISRS